RNQTRQIGSRHLMFRPWPTFSIRLTASLLSFLASVAQRHCGPSVQGRRDPMDYRDGHTAWWSRIGCDRAACQRLEMRDAPPRMLLVPKRRKIAPWFHGGSTPFRVALFYKTLRHNLLILLVPLAGLAFANISKGLDCQTALRGSIGPQR